MVEPSKPARKILNTQEEEKKNEGVLEVENVVFNPKIFNKNKSPFINQALDWSDEEHFKIPESIIKGIKEAHYWEKPSRIQGVAIPFIIKKDPDVKDPNYCESLIAQARNGAGKTGAFVIGSLLRIDPAVKKLQVVCVAHTRELVK